LTDLQWTVYPHSGHPLAEGRAQDRVSSPAKDRRFANQQGLMSHQTHYGHIRNGFLRVKRPTNSFKALKADRVKPPTSAY